MSISSIGPISTAEFAQSSSSFTAAHRAPPAMTETAQLLGVSTDQLSSDLQSGQTLSSLASKAGVSSSALLASVESDLKTNAPQGAPTLSSDQLQQLATSIIDGPGSISPGSSSTSSGTTSSLQSLSSSLGVDPSDLLSQLQSGEGLADLLQSSGTGYGSTGNMTDGLLYDQYL